MTPQIEVHVDHVRGLVAIAWPDRPGYYVIDTHSWYDESRRGVGLEARYTLPAGMTRLVDEDTALSAVAAAVAAGPPTRAPRRYQHTAQGG
jgi:hypothetical protein